MVTAPDVLLHLRDAGLTQVLLIELLSTLFHAISMSTLDIFSFLLQDAILLLSGLHPDLVVHGEGVRLHELLEAVVSFCVALGIRRPLQEVQADPEDNIRK